MVFCMSCLSLKLCIYIRKSKPHFISKTTSQLNAFFLFVLYFFKKQFWTKAKNTLFFIFLYLDPPSIKTLKYTTQHVWNTVVFTNFEQIYFICGFACFVHCFLKIKINSYFLKSFGTLEPDSPGFDFSALTLSRLCEFENISQVYLHSLRWCL